MKIAQILWDKVHWLPDTTETLKEFRSKFSPDLVFVLVDDEVQEGWEWDGAKTIRPIVDLDEFKNAHWQTIKATRDQLEQAGLPYMGKVLDSDPTSVQRIAIAVQAAQVAMAAGQELVVLWTCQDNSSLELTAKQLSDIPVALATYSNQLHQTARQLREQIDAAETVAALEAIRWPE